MNNINFEKGAAWLRADFHLHTQADKEFQYDGQDNSFINRYVDQLKVQGIQFGVITNHNKFDMDEFKALRKCARKQNITLLPGVELSVSEGKHGVHTLIVFADTWIDKYDYINPFLTAIFEGQAKEIYEYENGRTSYSLLDTIKKLEGYNRDFFLVFAHVDQQSGLWQEVSGGRLKEFGRNELFKRRTLGFQKVRTHDKGGKGEVSREKVKDWLNTWYPAELEGSDPKCIDEIGKGRHCYVKLGEGSFEAVKFALAHHTERVATTPPGHKGSYIERIQFEGGRLNGQTLHFSPELNTLIGIRGSGKSSILEAVRYALDIPLGEKAQDTSYKDALISHALGNGGKITLTARDNNGEAFTISRILGRAPDVFIDGEQQPGVSIQETILHKPIYFGQKDLSSTGEGFEKDLVEKIVGEKLRLSRETTHAQKERVCKAVQNWFSMRDIAARKSEFEAKLRDAEFRLNTFKKFGVTEKLQQQRDFQNDETALIRMQEYAQAFRGDLASLIAEHEDSLRNAANYTSKQNLGLFKACHDVFAGLIAKIDLLKAMEQETHTTAKNLAVKQDAFQAIKKEFQEAFAQTERQLAEELKQQGAAPIQTNDFLNAEKDKAQATQMLSVIAKQEAQQSEIYDALLHEINQLKRCWRDEFDIIEKELSKINTHHEALKMEAICQGQKESAIRFMQDKFRGSGMHATTLETVMANYADFGELFGDFKDALTRAGSRPETFEKIFMDKLADFITYQVQNRFIIRYRGKELKHHSLGQRASALLLHILSQHNHDVVMIDQPEDDLDNQTIYDDIIQLLRKMKPNTQFIFATHNANFPVLGDAEQVHACRYEDDTIHVESGSIDAKATQQNIINIMEGGKAAFDRRKEVYNIWT